jgi:membrane-associated protease RseP (regulator of RpoE activity)
MVVLIKILQVILALSILIIIHEAGHFFFAKLFRIRVEKFYLFFDVKFALFRFKPKNSDTEYGIGWLPLGGIYEKATATMGIQEQAGMAKASGNGRRGAVQLHIRHTPIYRYNGRMGRILHQQ